jgi:predicted nucleotide-binding protein
MPITARSLARDLHVSIRDVLRKLKEIGVIIDGPDDPIPEETLRRFGIIPAALKRKTGQVFIVHGHDRIRFEISSFLGSLDLKPIMLDENAKRGKTVIEAIEQLGNAAFAVVLLTPDDEGRERVTPPAKRPPAYKPRARQNVVLELGYFLARLGRERVCALYRRDVELPSDIDGLLKVDLDDDWRNELRNELTAAKVIR